MKKNILILGIETSCDETSVSIVKNGVEILSNITSSQIQSHNRFGGVVPEVASRHHVEQITLIIEEALKESKTSLEDINAIAVTKGPGLVGSLLIGINAAKSLAWAYNKPLIGVHHIAGHIYANRIIKELQFPLISLVISGGHTEIIHMKEHASFKILGRTRDDAVGEAYDKVARTLSLPYPGGPHIDKLAKEGKDNIPLPRAWLEPNSYDFSFSGLKSAVINTIHNSKQKNEKVDPKNLSASFQKSVIDVLTSKTIKAAKEYKVNQILLAGGVAANSGIRSALEQQCNQLKNIQLIIPPMSLCTDNAAMIAAAGTIMYEKGKYSDYNLNATPNLNIEDY